MKDFIKTDEADVNSRASAAEELGKAGDVKTNSQSLSVGIKLKTGVKAGPHVRVVRRSVRRGHSDI